MMDTIDPYVKIEYDNQEKKTPTIDNNESPEFNDE